MRISFGAVDDIQFLPAVTLGCSYTSQKPVLVTTCERKIGQWTVQTNSTLQVAFVCVPKIETHSENGGHWTVWRNAVFSLRFPWQTILWITSRVQNHNKSQHWLSISPAMCSLMGAPTNHLHSHSPIHLLCTALWVSYYIITLSYLSHKYPCTVTTIIYNTFLHIHILSDKVFVTHFDAHLSIGNAVKSVHAITWLVAE